MKTLQILPCGLIATVASLMLFAAKTDGMAVMSQDFVIWRVKYTGK